MSDNQIDPRGQIHRSREYPSRPFTPPPPPSPPTNSGGSRQGWLIALGFVIVVIIAVSALNNHPPVSPVDSNSIPTAYQIYNPPPTDNQLSTGNQIDNAAPQQPASAQPSGPGSAAVPTDPEAFIRWYFTTIISERNYDYLWGFMTDNFKNKMTPNGIEAYKKNWSYITQVDIDSVTLSGNDSGVMHYTVHMKYHYTNGTFDNGNYNFYLVFDNQSGHWMFDTH
jgi:hypothetical protein